MIERLKLEKNELLLLVIFSLIVSLISEIEYIKVANIIFDRFESWHITHITSAAPAPLQFRWLSFTIPEVFINLFGMKTHVAYLFERFIFLFLISFSYYIFLKNYFSKEISFFIILIFFYLYNLSAMAHIQPSEEINIFIFLLAYFAIVKDKFFLLSLILIIGALNKTTVIFLVPLFFVYQLLKEEKNYKIIFLKTFILGIITVAVLMSIKMYYGMDRDYLGGVWQYRYNIANMLDLNLMFYPYLLVSLLPFIFILFTWKNQPKIIKAIAFVIVPFLIGHFLISRVEEFRTYMPLALLTIPSFFFKYIKNNHDN